MWLLVAEKTERKISALVEQLKKDVSTVTNKVAEQAGTLATLLVQTVKKAG